MCLSTVFREVPGADAEKLAEFVSEVKIDGEKIHLTDVMGKEYDFTGYVKSVDLVSSKIIIA